MEDEKKKKKNKKKKNKQTKTSGDVTCDVGEPSDMDQNHVIQENHDNRASANADVQTDEPKTDVDMDGHFGNGTGGSALAEAEKRYCMDREAGLEEMIRKLQTDNDTHVEKEARLEETITRLQKENYAQMEKAGSFETKLSQLQNEKDSWLQKEVAFHGEINGLIGETASLSLKVVSLEEKIKQMEREIILLVEKENSMEETIACLNSSDKTRLEIQWQVMELEESRNSLLEENLRLAEILSGMQSQIQSIEYSIVSSPSSMAPVATMEVSGSEEEEEVNNQMKLVAENEELVEKKVNELCVELDVHGVTAAELSLPAIGSVSEVVGTAYAYASGERIHSPETSLSCQRTTDSRDDDDDDDDDVSKHKSGEYGHAPPPPSVTPNSDEIVQIPLDEKEVGGDPRLQTTHDNEKTDDVSLTDAPLIGAPFRLVSFMARYVSGADLVNKRVNSSS